MTRIEHAGPQTLRSGLCRAVLGCAAFVALAGFAGSAYADHHGGDHHHHGDDHHWHGHPVFHHWHHWDHRYYGGGYYPPPPVVYGSPYYEPPPVVYGPRFGLNIHIP